MSSQKSGKGKEKAEDQVSLGIWDDDDDDDRLYDTPARTPRWQQRQPVVPLTPLTPKTSKMPKTLPGPYNRPPTGQISPPPSSPTPASGIKPSVPHTGALQSPSGDYVGSLFSVGDGGPQNPIPPTSVAGNGNLPNTPLPPEDSNPILPATGDISAPAGGMPSGTSLKRPRDYEFTLRMSHGWTIGDGTFEPVPQDKRRRQDVPYPSFVGHSYRSRTALTSLQLAHDAPVSPCALDIACQHLWKCMPGEARKYLYISPPNGPALWGGNDESKRTAMYEKMDDKIYHVPVNGTDKTEYRHYADLKKRPWVIWPLWVEDQWGSDFITVIWHSEHAADDPDLFNQLVSYAIIDPRRSQEPDKNQRHQLVKGRLARIQGRLIDLWRKAGFNARRAKLLDVYCSPMPFDEATSGERCFAVVKELINQVINWYISGMQYHHGTTITSMSQWVNPFQQRVELAGICAWTLMASMDYNARIAVEAILPDTRWTVTSNGKEKYLHPYDLAGSYEEPPIASYDYLLPGGEKYMAPQTPKRGSRVSDRP